MERKISHGRKLSTDVHRKLSAISNCSDISNLSFKLGMDPNDFKSTIQNILDLDISDGWSVGDSDDELSCYGEETNHSRLEALDSELATAARSGVSDSAKMAGLKRKTSEVVTINVDRKSSTESQASNADSLDGADDFVPVNIDVDTVKQVIHLYQKHNRKASTSAPSPLLVTHD